MPRRLQIIDFADLYEGLDNQIILFCKNEQGGDECIFVRDCPLTICKAIGEDFDAVEELRSALDDHLIRNPPKCNRLECSCGGDKWGVFRYPCRNMRMRVPGPAVVGARIIRSRGILVNEDEDRPFIEFTLNKSFYLSAAARYLETVNVGFVDPKFAGVYDKCSNGVDEFILSKRVASFNWIELPDDVGSVFDYNDVQVIECANEMDVRSFIIDIETINDTNLQFSERASQEAAYLVGVVCTTLVTGNNVRVNKSFMLGAPLDDPETEFFDKEEDLLMALYDYIRETNPDLFFGYNSNLFDFPYLLRRAERLGLTQFRYFSRIPSEPVVYRIDVYESKQTGKRRQGKFYCPGRIFYDVLGAVRTDFKLSSYKLKDVAIELDLGAEKDDVDYEDIPAHFFGTQEMRRKLLYYCKKDVFITVKLAIDKMDLVRRLKAMCRIVGVSAQQVPDRGNSYLLGMMLRREMAGRYLTLVNPGGNDEPELHPALAEIEGYPQLWQNAINGEKYPGAFVFDPLVGVWKCCVITLDFNSLYPSIMSTFNICPSTQLPNPGAKDCNVSPPGFAYVKKEVRKGLLPALVERLISERKTVKNEMEVQGISADVYAMKNAEQKTLKVCANAFYGLMGSLTSIISTISGAYSVTAYGRYYIQMVCDALMELPDFEKKYGFAVARPGFVEKYGLCIIYGDTDSLMIALRKIFDPILVNNTIGPEIAYWVNKESGILVSTLKMGFENCSFPFLLLAKKKYVGIVVDGHGARKFKPSGIVNRSLTIYNKWVMTRILTMALVEDCSVDVIEAFIIEACRKVWAKEVARKHLKHSNAVPRELSSYAVDSPHIIAAKQMVAAGLPVAEGDRVSYYYCTVSSSKRKGDKVVAEPLMDARYTLCAHTYVQEIVDNLSKTVLTFVRGESSSDKEKRLKSLAYMASSPSFASSCPPPSRTSEVSMWESGAPKRVETRGVEEEGEEEEEKKLEIDQARIESALRMVHPLGRFIVSTPRAHVPIVTRPSVTRKAVQLSIAGFLKKQ